MSREESLLWSDLGFSLMRLYSNLQKEEKELAIRYQLGSTHLEMLFLLSRLNEGGWIPVRQLYPFFPLTQPAVGRILRHLAYWRFVELRRDKVDRRCLLVRLLPNAHKLLEEVESLRAQVLRTFFPTVTPQQLKSWVEALRNTTFVHRPDVEASMGVPI
ncbi:MAG: hypothetical protein N2170_02835 [Bacteroidia bacterium]|nr:hypothetical protein [Bacteroidia bacterium]